MFKKKDKEEEKRKKEKKQQLKEAKKEAKEKARKAKVQARLERERIKNVAVAKKEGWYEKRRPNYEPTKGLEAVKDIWSAARTGNLPQMQEFVKQGIGVGARDSVRKKN